MKGTQLFMPRLAKFWMLPYPYPFGPYLGAFNVPGVANKVQVQAQPRLVAVTSPAALLGMDFDGRRVSLPYDTPSGRG